MSERGPGRDATEDPAEGRRCQRRAGPHWGQELGVEEAVGGVNVQ